MKIAIVGNGASALNKKNGNFIDNCDIVVRLKNFKLEGFESHVGTRINWYGSKWFSWFDRETYKPLGLPFLNKVENFLFMFFDPSLKLEDHDNVYVHNYGLLQLKNEFPLKVGSLDLHNHYLKHFNILHKRHIYYTPQEINELAVNQLKIDGYAFQLNFKRGILIEPTVGIRTIFKMLRLFPNEEFFITGFDGFETGWYWDPKHKANPRHSYFSEILYLKKLTKSKQVYNLDE